MGKLLRHDPTAVTARLSSWLADPNSPHFWAPFALSMRGFAYEVMDELDLARMDYAKGLRLYDSLAMELGKETVKRMESNANFMRIRIRILPPRKLASNPNKALNANRFVAIAKHIPRRNPGKDGFYSAASVTYPPLQTTSSSTRETII
jgi:hypothetical protein